MKFGLLLLIIASCFSASAVVPITHDVKIMRLVKKDYSGVSQLNKIEASGTEEAYREIFDIIMRENNIRKSAVYLDWLQERILSASTTYLYPALYAQQLARFTDAYSKSEVKITAETMRLYSQLLYLTDAQRCDDNGVIGRDYSQLMKFMDQIRVDNQNVSKKVRKNIVETVLALEDKVTNRPKPRRICFGGAKHMMRIMADPATYKKSDIVTKENANGDPVGAHRITLENSGIEVDYISDEEWLKKREEIRNSLAKKYGLIE